MANLIVVITAIALTAIMTAIMMAYSGGDILEKGKDESSITKSLNEIHQIKTAAIAYRTRYHDEPTIARLLETRILASLPVGWEDPGESFTGGPGFMVRTIDMGSPESSEQACLSVNSSLGLSAIPMCSSILPGFSGCCQAH